MNLLIDFINQNKDILHLRLLNFLVFNLNFIILCKESFSYDSKILIWLLISEIKSILFIKLDLYELNFS